MYNINNSTEVKEILYSAQKNSKTKHNYKNFISDLNKKNLPFQKGNVTNKFKAKSSLNSNNINNIDYNIRKLNSDLSPNDDNTFNMKSKNNRKNIYINQNIPINQNNNLSLYYKNNNNINNLNTKDKNKEKFKNIFNSTGKQDKNYIRNLSEEQQLKINKNINNSNQRKSLRKESPFLNKILYNKNNNIYEAPENLKNKVQYNYNINKTNKQNYKDLLSKSSFNNSINNIESNNYKYLISNQNNSLVNDSTLNNIKYSKNQGSLKYIIPNKGTYKIYNYSTYNVNNNIKNENIKHYKKAINKNEKSLIKSNLINNNKNNIQLNNNIVKNNNILFNIKTNSYTPINNNNSIFTNPNNKKGINNQYYIIRDSLIYENDNNDNYKLSLNTASKDKKLEDKSCPKYIQNHPNNNYTNINNINNNNNYIVNVNKYINIIDKKNKIIKKASNGNGINIRNYNSYKVINNSKNNKKDSNDKNIKKEIIIKYNNYMNSPNNLFFNQNKNKNFKANSNTKEKYNIKNFSNINNNINKNNLRTNTQTDNTKGSKMAGFKKLKTFNYINRNNIKNENIYENENIYSNVKNPRKKYESDLKKTIIDSNSFKYFNKSNTNSSLINGINNNINNNLYKKKFINNKFYSDSLSSSTKNLNSSHRNSHNDYNYNFNTNINNIDRNNISKKGRNDKNNLGIIFKPQTIGQKLDFHLNKINSNRNKIIKVDEKNHRTIEMNDKNNNSLNYIKDKNRKSDNNIKNNFNLIKLMKTVKEYKNKNNKQRYENSIKENKNNNIKYNSGKTSNNYITNFINNINDDQNILFKKKLKGSYNPGFSEMTHLKSFNENKVLQNITQNTLKMYSIYILSPYFTDFTKIGLSKIILLNENNEKIPVICTNNNCGKDTNKLFDISQTNKNKEYKKPFITEFKNNIYINFYINNIQSHNIKYIQITNYTDLKNRVSPVGRIEIFQSKKLIFKGILNSNKISNIVLSNIKNERNNIKEMNNINDINDINEISVINNRPYSLSKYRSMEDETNPNEINDIIMNSEYDNFYTTRGTLYKGFPNLINDYNYKNIDIDNYDQQMNYKITLNDENNIDKDYNNINMNSLKNYINDFELDSLLSLEFNKTSNKKNNKGNSHNNTYKSNNINDKYEVYNTNNSINKLSYSNSNNNITINDNNNNINNAFFNMFRKTYNKNEIEDFDQIFKTSINKMREYSSFKLKNSINHKQNRHNNSDKKNKELNNDINLNINSYNNEEESFSNINLNNENLDNYNIYNNTKSPNYIEFNKIRFIISSNYGHHKYVGLTGLELFNVKGDPINIESALTIGALPKDLRTLYNDEKENRIFENVFNRINNTNDSDNMWVTKLKKNNPMPFIELFFKEKLRISKMRIYNYNERDKLNIGAKTIELYLDDEYYNTIYLKQGTGEIASGYIKIKRKINKDKNELTYDLDDSDMNKNEDFGQDITFPIIDITQNDLLTLKNTFYSSLNSNFKNSNNNIITDSNNNNIDNKQIKYASFLYRQSYETPYLPCGYYIKLVFSSNYYKGTVPLRENDLKYSDMGLNKVEIYDENGKNIISNNNDLDNNSDDLTNYKIISNCEILTDENEEENNINDKIIINGGDIGQNENGNNCVFYIFDKPKRISYIKFYPLEEDNKPLLNSVKEIKIFSDCKIIFEGILYLDKPTIVLFTCERKILNNLNENYLTKEINERTYKEQKKGDTISLVLN